MIMAGLGIGPLPIHVVERDARRQTWSGGCRPTRRRRRSDIFLVTHPRAQLNRAERALITILEEHLDALPIEERTYPRSA